jgi:hypothetical protein
MSPLPALPTGKMVRPTLRCLIHDEWMPKITIDGRLVWDVAKAVVPILISCVALFFVLNDRRARLDVRSKRGDWYNLRMTLGSEMIFQGVIEVYNRSSRSNAIRAYSFEYKDINGKWKPMESEQYTNKSPDGERTSDQVYNRTALAISPYSGVEVWVQALTRSARPKERLQVRITIEDLFGKQHKKEVNATF